MTTQENFRKRYDEIIGRAGQLSVEKSELYGTEDFGELGPKAEFIQIHRKYRRIKKLIWDEKVTGTEEKHADTIEDSLLDMINYSVIALMVLEEDGND